MSPTITGSDIESRQPLQLRHHLEQLAAQAGLHLNADLNRYVTSLLHQFDVQDRGMPIDFRSVKVGDRIRAVRTRHNIVSIHVAIIHKTTANDLFATNGQAQGAMSVIATADDDLYLLERAAPAKLGDMSPGMVKDSTGKTFMYDGTYVYHDGDVALGDTPSQRPWSQVSRLKNVADL